MSLSDGRGNRLGAPVPGQWSRAAWSIVSAPMASDSDGIPKTPEWAEARCGIPAETIRRLAIESMPQSVELHRRRDVAITRQASGTADIDPLMAGSEVLCGRARNDKSC